MSSTDDYGSPPEVYGPCLEVVSLPAFDLDPCSHVRADGSHPVPARKVYTLADPWPATGGKRKVSVKPWTRAELAARGIVCEGRRPVAWLNPPYSQPEGWARAAAEAAEDSPTEPAAGVVTFALVRLSVGCGWWREYMARFWAVALSSRLAFITLEGKPSGTNAMFDCALVVCSGFSRQLADRLATRHKLGQLIAPAGYRPPAC